MSKATIKSLTDLYKKIYGTRLDPSIQLNESWMISSEKLYHTRAKSYFIVRCGNVVGGVDSGYCYMCGEEVPENTLMQAKLLGAKIDPIPRQ